MTVKNRSQAIKKSGLIVASRIDGLTKFNAVLRFKMAARQIVGAGERNEGHLLILKQGVDAVLQGGMQAPVAIECNGRMGVCARSGDGA